MMVSWPGTTPAGKVSQHLISFSDFLPTLAELAGARMPMGVMIDGKPFTPMFHGEMGGKWLRDWIFVLLRHEWFNREKNWKLNQSGELFDMRNAPYSESLVPADTKESEALAARQRLQTALTRLNPAAGKVDPGNMKSDRKKNREKMHAGQNGTKMDGENANAPDQ